MSGMLVEENGLRAVQRRLSFSIVRLGIAGPAALLAAHPAWATATIRPVAEFEYDDNVFRTSGQPGGGRSRSDGRASVSAQLDAAATAGSWEGSVIATATRDTYVRNDFLNNFNYSLAARVRNDGPVLGVTVTASQDRRLSNFEEILVGSRNVQTVTRGAAEARYAIGADLRLIGVAEYVRSVSSSSQLAVNDYRRIGGGIGIGYYSPAGNFVTITARRTDGAGLTPSIVAVNGQPIVYRIDYVDSEVRLGIHYAPSVVTTIDGNIGYTHRNDRSSLRVNSSGLTGDVTLTYLPRETWKITARARRQFQSESFLFTGPIRTTELSLASDMAFSPQTSLLATLRRGTRAFSLAFQSGAVLRDRRDTTYAASIALTHRLTERLKLQAEARHETRNSNAAALDYKANVIGITASYDFGLSR